MRLSSQVLFRTTAAIMKLRAISLTDLDISQFIGMCRALLLCYVTANWMWINKLHFHNVKFPKGIL